MYGEIFFDMTRDAHRKYGESKFLVKRWKKYDIFTKTGSFTRSENPRANTYASTSVYLYDYVVVSDTWFLANVAEVEPTLTSSIPAPDRDYYGFIGGVHLWNHYPNTWKNAPNDVANNYIWRFNPIASAAGARNRPVYGYDSVFFGSPAFNQLMKTPIFRDDGTYFEIIRGYPRSHIYHKRSIFSLERYTSYGNTDGVVTSQQYQRGRQTFATTVGENGLGDGSDPVQNITVSNVDIIKSDNVIYH